MFDSWQPEAENEAAQLRRHELEGDSDGPGATAVTARLISVLEPIMMVSSLRTGAGEVLRWHLHRQEAREDRARDCLSGPWLVGLPVGRPPSNLHWTGPGLGVPLTVTRTSGCQ